MNSVFHGSNIPSQKGQRTIDRSQRSSRGEIDRSQRSSHGEIDHTTPGVYVYKPLGFTSSFERVPDLIPAVYAAPRSPAGKKRKSASTQTEFKTLEKASDKDGLDYFRATKSRDEKAPIRAQKRLRFDAELDLGDEEVDLYCYEDAEEIFEDIDMEKQLKSMTALPVQKPVWVDGSEFQHLQGSHRVDPVSVDIYSSFKHWGTDKSPFAHSISQLY